MAILNKYRKELVLSISLAFFFVVANLASAETKVFVEECTYHPSEYDSKVSCRALALEQVKRLLLEKVGTYLANETEVRNFQLTKEQIVSLTAGVVRSEIIEEKWDGKTYFLKGKITADPNEVIKSIDLLRQDRQKTKELEETRKKADEALKEVERLRKELETAKAGGIEQGQYTKAVNKLRATDWFEKGLALGRFGEWREAGEAFTRAIELDPNDAKAHLNRGVAYGNLGNYQQKVRDLDKAIELDPKYAAAYFNRGIAYANLGNHRQEIADYDKAIQLDPNDAKAHLNRGVAYAILGDYRQAIRDWDEAIELDPTDAQAYYARGLTYGKLGDDQQKIRDFRAAARLGDREVQNYLRSKGIEW